MTKGGQFCPGHDVRWHKMQKKTTTAKEPDSNGFYYDQDLEMDRQTGYQDGLRGVTDSRNAKVSVSAYLDGNSVGINNFNKSRAVSKKTLKNEVKNENINT